MLSADLRLYESRQTLSDLVLQLQRQEIIRMTQISPEPTMLEVLTERFRMSSFRPGQVEVIERLLRKESSLAIFPTGGGKSLCYQLPAVMLPNLTIVVSPLLALIREQVDTLNKLGIRAVRIDSTLDADQYREAVDELRNRKAKILYVAPERLFNERFRELLRTLSIDLLAVDEAHCISQWGHNFRPDYLRLGDVVKQYSIPLVLALTATATPNVADDIRTTFGIKPSNEIRTPSYRPNLSLQFMTPDRSRRDRFLCDTLRKCERPAIVYTTLQATSESVATMLGENGFDAQPYHAGMSDEDRQSVQDSFMNSDSKIIVATIAFGMGVDKPNIRTIVHYNMSNGLENYAQEVGRAGRDGHPSQCITFVDAQDRTVLQNFAHGDLPDQQSVRDLIDLISKQLDEFYVSYYQLGFDFDIRDTVLRTILTYLELDGYLKSIGPRYDKYEFKPIKPLHWIVQQFKDERRSFADSVLSMSVKKKIWTEVNLAVACQRLQQPRQRVTAMLEYFAEKGWIELKPSGLMYGYRFEQRFADIDSTVSKVFERLSELEQRSIQRIDQLVSLAESPTCQAVELARHFGDEDIDACRKCSACLGKTVSLSEQDSQLRGLGTSIGQTVHRLQSEYEVELNTPRQLAKFLCGINSPKTIRKRLTRDDSFGSCSHLPFNYVLSELNKIVD